MTTTSNSDAIDIAPFPAVLRQSIQQLSNLELTTINLSSMTRETVGDMFEVLQSADNLAGFEGSAEYQQAMLMIAQRALNQFAASVLSDLVLRAGQTGLKQITELQIVGRRWFQRGEGNTYHSVKVYVTDHTGHASILASGYNYGHGDGYIQTAQDLLQRAGFDIRKPAKAGANWSLNTVHLRETLGADYQVTDVSRKSDLTNGWTPEQVRGEAA